MGICVREVVIDGLDDGRVFVGTLGLFDGCAEGVIIGNPLGDLEYTGGDTISCREGKDVGKQYGSEDGDQVGIIVGRLEGTLVKHSEGRELER